jgi:4-hydroxybenzoate polyprenyltransferase
MPQLRQLVRACHPEPTAAVTAITTALAVAAGRGAGAVWVALAVLAGQLSVGWSNDWVDRDRDRAAARAEKPVAAGRLSARAVRSGAMVALVVCLPLSLASGPAAAVVHLAAVGAAWAYNLRLKSTVMSVAPYAVAFGLLPAFVTLGLRAHTAPPLWAVLAGALMGSGAHFLNTLPDLDDDVALGVRGLPQRLGYGRSLTVGLVLLAASGAVLSLGPARRGWLAWGGLAVLLAAVAAVGVAARSRGPKAAFPGALVVAAVAVALLLARGHALA